MNRLIATAALAAILGLGAADASGRGPLFGFMDDWTSDPARALRMCELARPLRTDLVRVNAVWESVERAPGWFDWGYLDNTVAVLRERRIGFLLCLVTSPEWARPGDSRPNAAPHPDYDAYWARMARELVLRYPDAAGVEVWNEPNILPFGSIPPGRYAQLFRTACDAMRSVRPTVVVVSAGLWHSEPKPGQIGWQAYLRRFLGLVPDKSFAVGLHPYPRGGLNRTAEELAGSVDQQIRSVKSITERPIWITEVGVSTGRTTAEIQAKSLRLIYQSTFSAARIRAVFFFRLVDSDYKPDSAWESGLGICNLAFRPKRAYWALKRLRT